MAETDGGRRRLLVLGLGAGAAGLAAAAGGPTVVSLLDPVGRRTVIEGDQFVDVAGMDELHVGKPYRVTVRADRIDAWNVYRNEELGSAYLLRDADGTVKALSTICPHLGCVVDHDQEKNGFVCPCHDSFFSQDGAAVTGPSPRGLYPLDTRVEDGRVFLKFQRFG